MYIHTCIGAVRLATAYAEGFLLRSALKPVLVCVFLYVSPSFNVFLCVFLCVSLCFYVFLCVFCPETHSGTYFSYYTSCWFLFYLFLVRFFTYFTSFLVPIFTYLSPLFF